MSISSLSQCEPLKVQHTPTATVIKTIAHWPHQRGGEGHCLARIYFDLSSGVAIALLSELRSNSRATAMGVDFGDVASALIPCLKKVGLTIEESAANIQWIAHYGQFSFWDTTGDDTFIQVFLAWEGQQFIDLGEERRLNQQEVLALLNPFGVVELESVYRALADLDWTKHNE